MTTNSRRDQSLEQLLRQSRAADPAFGGGSPCPDAETFAAWADGGLPPHALAAAEAHAAGCARCEATVAVLMKQPVQVPEIAPPRAWKWSAGWLVPVAAGIAAVGVWFAVPHRTAPADKAPSDTRAMVDKRAEAPQAPEPFAPAAREEPAGAPAVADPAVTPTEQRSSAANAAPRAEALRRDQASTTPLQAEALPSAGPSPARESVGLATRPEAPSAAAAGRQRMVLQDAAGPLQVESPDSSIRWRIGAGGAVEVSADAGLSWRPQASGVTADLTAGSAPAASVCWLVGRAGTVLRTSDGGRTWLRLGFPQTLDLVAVEAADPLTATVTASDGRIFRTIDAGRTWQ